MKTRFCAMIGLASMAIAGPASAVTFTNISNTGVANAWTVATGTTTNGTTTYGTASTAQTVTSPIWFANTATSSWIAPTSSGTAASGSYQYATTFSAANVLAGDKLDLRAAADDTIRRVLLNGNVVYTGTSGTNDYSSFRNLSFSGLLDGSNTIQFEISNNQSSTNATNPSGFRAEFSNAAAVPEPATWSMMIVGFGMAGSAMRRRRSNVAYAS